MVELLQQMYVKRLFQEVEVILETVTVSDTRKVDLTLSLLDSIFCGPMFKRLTQ